MALKLEEYTRNRCVGWVSPELATKAKAAGVKVEAGKGIYSNDLMTDDGVVSVALCDLYGVRPEDVKPITVADLPAEYASGPSTALKKLAQEWEMSESDVVHHLTLNARLQDAANDTLKRFRPVTDRAHERMFSTAVRVFARQDNISEEEAMVRYASVLNALKPKR